MGISISAWIASLDTRSFVAHPDAYSLLLLSLIRYKHSGQARSAVSGFNLRNTPAAEPVPYDYIHIMEGKT